MMNNRKLALGGAIFAFLALTTFWYFKVWYYSKGIHPVGEGVPFKEITINAEKGGTYHHTTGTDITIPPNAFVNRQGETITGTVTIAYREFHNAYDLAMSGIPMGDIAKGALQSASMMEINANQDGNELLLADGKNIGVQLASFKNLEGYDLFRLNENFEWDLKGKPSVVQNDMKLDSCAKLKPLPIAPMDPREGEGDIVVETEADYQALPQYQPLHRLRWKAIELDKIKDGWVFRMEWDKIKVNKSVDGEYVLQMSANKQLYNGTVFKKSYSMKVLPILTGKDLELAMKEFEVQLATYETNLKLALVEEQRLAQEADIKASFAINEMGVWNCDKIVDPSLFVEVEAQFLFSEPVNPFFNKIAVYVIDHDRNTVQQYHPLWQKEIYLVPNSNTSIMAVLPNRRIALMSAAEFKQLAFNKTKPGIQRLELPLQVYPSETVTGNMVSMR
ncbi:MAG: hypothetical protein SFW35_10485 [Chitinophagales bacterium]|nr:hypothetical protein [Chitinophagales bacterium]